MNKLLALAKTLRGKNGCPWDKSITLADIPKNLIEESEEIREAIEKEDWENLKEEIGDLLFNLCLMMTIAEEKGHFKPEDIITHNAKKITERHTWVFGEDKANTPEEAIALWNKNKAKKKTSSSSQ
ncbi:MAG: MazG nucleotide pyrophosphohydrolase domain-containing protein [bacterium]|nr:MazG nucleotide pyrophosphohydrolase domain-containing protein [bacterium]